MKIVALGSGTSQGVPIIGCKCEVCLSTDKRNHRLRSSVYVESTESRILIDIGPDFRTQFLRSQLDSIDLVLITHEHNDHIIGLDDLRAINFTQKKGIPIYAEERVADQIKERFSYAFSDKHYPGLPVVSMHHLDMDSFSYKDVLIVPVRIWHGNLPILGFRINDFAYITDANRIDEEEIDKIRGVKVLIINALRQEKHYSHFTLEECLAHIEKINPEKAFITHISHNMGLYTDWAANLPKNVRPLEDMMVFSI